MALQNLNYWHPTALPAQQRNHSHMWYADINE